LEHGLGSFIGLMAIPMNLYSAFDWYWNTQEGINIFCGGKLERALDFQNYNMGRCPDHRALTNEELERVTLEYYRGAPCGYPHSQECYYRVESCGSNPRWEKSDSLSLTGYADAVFRDKK
jgi:hypothetical protein